MNEPKDLTVDMAIEDVFSDAKVPEFMWGRVLSVVRRGIKAHCENEGIPLGHVNMSRTLINVRVTVELEMLEDLLEA